MPAFPSLFHLLKNASSVKIVFQRFIAALIIEDKEALIE